MPFLVLFRVPLAVFCLFSIFFRFSRLALRILLLAFFGRSVSFFPAYFHPKPFLHELELEQFPPVDKVLTLSVLLLCELIKNCKILRINVQLQPHQFDFRLKMRAANYLLTRLYIY